MLCCHRLEVSMLLKMHLAHPLVAIRTIKATTTSLFIALTDFAFLLLVVFLIPRSLLMMMMMALDHLHHQIVHNHIVQQQSIKAAATRRTLNKHRIVATCPLFDAHFAERVATGKHLGTVGRRGGEGEGYASTVS